MLWVGGPVGALILLWALHPWKTIDWTIGDVDPAGALIGTVALLLAVTVAVRDLQHDQTDIAVLADRLAQAVLIQEQEARRAGGAIQTSRVLGHGL